MFPSDSINSWNTFSCPRTMGRTWKQAGHTIPSCTIPQISRQDSTAAFKVPSKTSSGYQNTGKISRRLLINTTWMLQLLKLCGCPSKQDKIPILEWEFWFQATARRDNFWGRPEPEKEKAKRVQESLQREFRCSAGIAGGQQQFCQAELGDCQGPGLNGCQTMQQSAHGDFYGFTAPGRNSCWISKEAFVLRFCDPWAALAEPLERPGRRFKKLKT